MLGTLDCGTNDAPVRYARHPERLLAHLRLQQLHHQVRLDLSAHAFHAETARDPVMLILTLNLIQGIQDDSASRRQPTIMSSSFRLGT